VQTLAGRLADQRRRMDELTAGDLAVRACFQVSFDALPRPAQPGGADPAHVFRLLGVWQGSSIGLPAVAALAGQAGRNRRRRAGGAGRCESARVPGPDRCRFHDLLRAHAAERAQADEEPGDVEAAIRRVLTWYLRAADAAGVAVSPHRNPVPLEPPEPGAGPSFAVADEALGWCEVERANLVAATRQAAQQGLHDIAWKLPVAAMMCFELHGYRAEWLTTHRIALASARASGGRLGEARVLNNLGIVLGEQRADDAIGYFERPGAGHQQPRLQLPVPRTAPERGGGPAGRARPAARDGGPAWRGHRAAQSGRVLP
jgi:hypothetical protein